MLPVAVARQRDVAGGGSAPARRWRKLGGGTAVAAAQSAAVVHSAISTLTKKEILFACFPPSHRKESHTKTEGIKLLKYALQISFDE
jgi:hypothetical protein